MASSLKSAYFFAFFRQCLAMLKLKVQFYPGAANTVYLIGASPTAHSGSSPQHKHNGREHRWLAAPILSGQKVESLVRRETIFL